MEWVELLVEFLSAIAWPAVALTILFTFKDDIRKKFPGITKAGPTGIEFQQQGSPPVPWTGELKEIPGFSRTPLMAEVEKKIFAELQNIKEAQHIDLLVRHLGQKQLEVAFERIYASIFGSQMDALNALVSAGGKVARNRAITWFQETIAVRPENSAMNFEEWLRYLVTRQLVTDDAHQIEITEIGREFLLYVSAAHPFERRLF